MYRKGLKGSEYVSIPLMPIFTSPCAIYVTIIEYCQRSYFQ